MLRVVVVDDHHLFREGVRAVLRAEEDISVVGEAACAITALRAVEQERPDVVVLDIALPNGSGLETARAIVARGDGTRVLVLTMYAAYADQALSAGATGYALKTEPAGAIVAAIRAVGRGDRYVGRTPSSIPPSPPQPLGLLSTREGKIFHLVVQGLSNDSLASRLGISVKTIETHRASINRKLGLHSTAEIVRFAARHGLIPL